ncbi:MAG: hypothetical protein IPJ65_15630 [Archangiaceae bacterium]|nr:hypothetical protein [Archangiaceae bacterium]
MLVAVMLMALASNPYLEEGGSTSPTSTSTRPARAMQISVGQPGLSRDELREAFDLWAQALLAMGRREDAERTYARLLREDPYVPAPTAAPKVRECFERAKRSVWPPPSVKLSSTREGPHVTVTVFDPWSLVQRLRFLQATPDALVEAPAPLVTERVYSATPTVHAQRLLFDALDSNGAMLAHLELPVEGAVVATALEPAPTRRSR